MIEDTDLEYNGFISTLIERSEQLLLSDQADDLNVTRLLLVLNTGFALVRDRIRGWDNSDDGRLRTSNLKKEVNKACDRKFVDPIKVREEVFFESFRTCGDWAYFRVPKDQPARVLSALDFVRILRGREAVSPNELSLDAVMQALRNSLAHGGVFPMSYYQAESRLVPSAIQLHGSQQIDRVYFVSKWTGGTIQDHLGWIVMEFGVDALRVFWEDWKALILAPGRQALAELDRVA